MGTGALASQGGVGAQLRVKIGAGNAELRAGFLQARGGRGQILILGPDRRFEPVQFRFAKNFPPRAARQSGGGRADFQSPTLLVEPDTVKASGIGCDWSATGR